MNNVSNALNKLEEGVESWNEWRRGSGAGKVSLTEADLSETIVAGADFSGVDAKGIDLYGTDLTGANLKMSNFEGADLSRAQLCSVGGYKVCLKGAHLTEANLEGADLSEADLRGADLRGANLRGVNFQGALLTGALDSSYGNALFVRDAKDQDYLDTMEVMINRLPEGRLKKAESMAFRVWALIDYGRSLFKVTFYAFLIASIYATFYTLDMSLGWGLMDYSNSAQSWFTPFYYSIVTYTTLGFGDVTANTWLGEIIIISEVIIGYFTLGLLLSILANTIARRS